MTDQKEFSAFKVGEIAVFEQRFEASDFDDFTKLSGDHNPLHHDAEYAATSEFNRPIVPMHMTIAPLSRIAGMIFPGDPSLYLSHEVRSILPVFYEDNLRYSARITAVNENLRTLTIRVLVLRKAEVVIDAQMRVMARVESWAPQSTQPDLTPAPAASLVTGATGAIGTALTLHLARRGHDLVLVDRGDGPKREALATALANITGAGQRVDFLTADLTKPGDVADLCEALSARDDVTSVFHSASPPLDAPLGDLVQVNYTALQQISEAVLPAMLLRQEGVLTNVGSVATERVIPGWHDYAAAKAMAGQFIGGFDKTHGPFGVRGVNILAGLVATAYSLQAQGSAPAMAPQELAEAIVEVALDERIDSAVMVEWNGRRNGAVGFHEKRPTPAPVAPSAASSSCQTLATDRSGEGVLSSLKSQVAEVLRARLNLPEGTDLSEGGVGNTPGWDSLRHIELVLHLEERFGIRYSASDVEKMFNFQSLIQVTRARIDAA